MKKVLEYLEQLDFSETEAKIYLTLLQSGPLTVAQLAQEVAMNRTAVYPHITNLLKKGFVAEVIQGFRKQLIATEPEGLQYLIEKKINSVKAIQAEFPNMVNLINTSFTKAKNKGKIDTRYYKGKNGVTEIYKEALQSTELRSYFNNDLIRQVLPDNFDLFLKGINTNKQLVSFELLQESQIARKQQQEFKAKIDQPERYFAKFLPEGVSLTALDILIYDGKIATINVEDKNDITGIVMENRAFYTNSKELFDLIWKMLPEPDKKP